MWAPGVSDHLLPPADRADGPLEVCDAGPFQSRRFFVMFLAPLSGLAAENRLFGRFTGTAIFGWGGGPQSFFDRGGGSPAAGCLWARLM